MASVQTVRTAQQLSFYAAIPGVLKSKACGTPLADKEHRTEGTEGQIVYFSTSCIATHYQGQWVWKIGWNIRSAKRYSFAIFTKIIRLHGNFFWLSKRIWIMWFFLTHNLSQSLIPADNRDEMNWRTTARYRKKKKKAEPFKY